MSSRKRDSTSFGGTARKRFDPLLVERADVVADVLVDAAVDLDGRARLAGEHRLGADDVRHVVLHAPSGKR